MQDLIVGAGAVGIGVGSALLAAGRDVGFVARGAVGERLRLDGVSRSGLFGEHSFPGAGLLVLSAISECRVTPHRVIVAVKSTCSAAVASEIAACPALADAPVPIVLLQNGLGNAEHFVARFPRERVWTGVVITGFHLRGPTHVEITAHAAPIKLGHLFGGDPAVVGPLAEAIDRGGIPCITVPQIERDLWAKVLYNASLNPLGALLDVPYGVLAERPETRAILDAVMDEIFDVMRAEGAETHWTTASAYRSHFYEKLIPPTAAHESSMLQDLRAGRLTEIDALSGAIVSRGDAHGVATPVSSALATLIRAREGARSRQGR